MKKVRHIARLLIYSCLILLGLFFFIPMYCGHNDTKMMKAKIQIEDLEAALEQYHKDCGRYPSTEEGLQLLVKKKNPRGEVYLLDFRKDPWGIPYYYCSPGIHNKESYDLWTYGADNAPGGKDENEDIANWKTE